jgi:hypothetical protein
VKAGKEARQAGGSNSGGRDEGRGENGRRPEGHIRRERGDAITAGKSGEVVA